MVRVPAPGRFELRLADGGVNPYLLQAIVIAAGLEGLKTRADPGPHLDIDMYKDGHLVKDAPRLPLNLLDALRAYEGDNILQKAMGEEFSAAYLKLKYAEWDASARSLRRGACDDTRRLVRLRTAHFTPTAALTLTRSEKFAAVDFR